MSNLLPFPTAAAGGADAGANFLLDPPPQAHAVRFYDSEAFLFETVGRYLSAGMRSGDALVVVATHPHRAGFLRSLGAFDVARALDDGQLLLLDARETLSKFMVRDMPDPHLFREVLASVLRNARGKRPGARVRVYGEMVNLLWKEGNSRAAIRLEELWNEAGKTHGFSLLCAYVMGPFYKEGGATSFMDVCRNHSHVIPAETSPSVENPLGRLHEVSPLQQHAWTLESELQQRKELESALRDALRDRARVEEDLRACVKREQQAREQAEANDAFKELFLGILGHDLRNPLSTVLTTARLMKLRGEVTGETERRVDRIVTSGVRMQRMIDQLLDVARARLTDGIPVTRQWQDLVPLVTKIVDEVRTVNPTRRLEIEVDGTCAAPVDGDRFEQVVSNLLGNAIVHGSADRPITVSVGAREGMVRLSVHNFGRPIDPALMPSLFDPFKRGGDSRGGPAGLGLGLYIVERIVNAHGGTVAVQSAPDVGTAFEVTFPLGVA